MYILVHCIDAIPMKKKGFPYSSIFLCSRYFPTLRVNDSMVEYSTKFVENDMFRTVIYITEIIE